MIYTPATRLALQIAEEAHRGQTDSAGFPYILHPILVAEQQKIEAAVVAALLHDVCEDCGITLKELLDRGVPKEAVEAVRLLTHRKGVPYLDYIRAMQQQDRRGGQAGRSGHEPGAGPAGDVPEGAEGTTEEKERHISPGAAHSCLQSLRTAK